MGCQMVTKQKLLLGGLKPSVNQSKLTKGIYFIKRVVPAKSKATQKHTCQGSTSLTESLWYLLEFSPQTFGISSNDSSLTEQSACTNTSQRSHELAPGQNKEGIIGASSKNYFAEFLGSGRE